MPSPTAMLKQTQNQVTSAADVEKQEAAAAADGVEKFPLITSGVVCFKDKRFEGLPANIALHTIIGGRKSQEDRFCLAPRLLPDIENVSFFGVFDGTVGDFASDNIKDIVIPQLKSTPAFQKLHQQNDILSNESKTILCRQAMRSMYSKSDEELLKRCGEAEKHYATCTSVTLLMWQDLICVGHIGDSRVCLIFAPNDKCRDLGERSIKAPYVTRAQSGPSGNNNNKENNTISGVPTATVAKMNSDIKESAGDCPGPRDNMNFMGNAATESEGDNEGGNAMGKKFLDSINGNMNNRACDSTTTPTVASEMEGESGCEIDNQSSVNTASFIDPKYVAPGAFRTDSMPADQVYNLIEGNFITRDHKPDQHDERQRIEKSGGSVEYLQNHQNKPFIRGGDFQQRKMLGESPMQLQYSRAFGGKDLKPFGLTAEPSINITKREKQFIGFILASDGLWDVVGADTAARVATKAWLEKKNPSEALVNAAVDTSGDNITVVCVMYDTAGGDR